MKKSSILIGLVTLLAVFAVIGSGCLSSGEGESAPDTPAKLAGINYVHVYTDKENVIAQLEVIIYGTHAQKVNKENIVVKIDGNDIFVTVPVTESGPANTRDIGYETVTVILGTKDQFKAGERYTVNVNGNEIKSLEFEFVDGVMNSYKPASIDQMVVETEGKDIVVTALVAIGGGANSIATDEITTSGKFDDENNYEITIPLKTRDGISTMEMKWGNEKFVVGQTDKLANGTYQVIINGQVVSFTLENGTVTQNI